MNIAAFIHDITSNPWASLAIILNLVLIESLLSVDNAAVLATMVLSLDKKDRSRALSFGIIGAYIFRGLCLFFASFLIKIWWLKAIAGGYLVYLFIRYFINKRRKGAHESIHPKQHGKLYNNVAKWIGPFWTTVLSVELMDLTFSIDNVFAAVAFTNNIILVWTGVFIGILAMRIVARLFVILMERFPFLEVSAFIVLGILGLKLTLSVLEHTLPQFAISHFLRSEAGDISTSVFTACIFLLPLISSWLFNIPPKQNSAEKQGK